MEQLDDPRTKACSSCKYVLPLDCFYKQKRPNGNHTRQPRCKQCANSERWANGRFKDEAAKQRVYEINKASYQKNKEKYRIRALARQDILREAGKQYLGDRCMRCPQDHPATLQFHHRDPSTKRFEVSRALLACDKYTWEELKEEMDKCDLICANCHEIDHYIDRDSLGVEYTEARSKYEQEVLASRAKNEDYLGQKDGRSR